MSNIKESCDNNVIDNILSEMNTQNQVINNNQQNVNVDPNNTPSFNTNKSDKFMSILSNSSVKSSIIVGVLIVIFSFAQINKIGKVALKVNYINNLNCSYIFPYIVNGILGGVIFYYLSNLNI